MSRMMLAIFILFVVNLISCLHKPEPSRNVNSEMPDIINGQDLTNWDVKEAVVGLGPIVKCTGTYIGNNKIVTAAHCINADEDTNKILPPVAKFQHRNGNFDCSVINTVTPKDFNIKYWQSDIAVFTVKCNSKLIETIKPFLLDNGEYSLDKGVFVAGYGGTSKDDRSNAHFPNLKFTKFDAPVSLLEAINTLPSEDIESKYGFANLISLAKHEANYFFKVKKDSTTLRGDSGGPVYVKDQKGNNILVGVTTLGYDNIFDQNGERTNKPFRAYFASSVKVQKYYNWILQNSNRKISSTNISEEVEIINGQDATEENLRHAVVGISPARCSGTYIGNNKIVSAGHCMDVSEIVTSVIPPRAYFQYKDDMFSCKIIDAVKPKDYNIKYWQSDIAIFTVKCESPLIKKIKPFLLDDGKADLTKGVQVAGYGGTSKDDKSNFHFPNLKMTNLDKPVPLIDAINTLPTVKGTQEQTQGLKNLIYLAKLDTNYFHLAKENSMPLPGDSGGPVYVKNKNGEYVLVGINSVAYYDADLNPKKDFKGYFFTSVKVQKYRQWILQN